MDRRMVITAVHTIDVEIGNIVYKAVLAIPWLTC